MHFMVPHKKSSPLTRLTESLIAMNGHSESSKDMQVSWMRNPIPVFFKALLGLAAG
jgi:hypothetical protein